MGKLESIAIAGFKSFGDEVEVQLRPLTLLIGANGSGKSNFMGAFAFLQAFASKKLVSHVERAGGADRLLHFGSRHTQRLSMRVTFGEIDAYTLEFYRGAGDRIHIDEESLDEHDFFAVGMPQYPDVGQRTRNTISRLGTWRAYHFLDTSFDSPMKKTPKVGDNRFLRQDGSNLASFLYLLRAKHGESYRAIRGAVQRVAPFFDDFILEPSALRPDTIHLEWRHRGSDAYFDVSSLSDGTLRFMALAALMLQPRKLRPDIILLDEPELGLHPYAITMLAAMLRSASRETQIVVATQSPILVDHFEPEDVLVAERNAGQTRMNRLDAEKLHTWLQDYSLGQLWEKNQLGGRPAREALEPG